MKITGKDKNRRDQIDLCQTLAKIFVYVLYHTGMSKYFEIVSFPDGNIATIKIFQINLYGEPIFNGSKRNGVLVLQIEIQLPILFSLQFKNCRHEDRMVNLGSDKELIKRSKSMLEEILCTFWLKLPEETC